MAIDFPSSPSANDTHTVNGRTYVWTGDYWKISGTSSQGINLEISDTTPASPIQGDMWFESDTGRTYTYYDGFWVELGNTAQALTNYIIDADSDTRIHVEESADEDIIRFDTAGVERATIDAAGDVTVFESLTVGGGASVSGALTGPTISTLQSDMSTAQADIDNLESRPVETKTASYVLVASDVNKRIVMNNAGATTITVNDSVFAAGDTVWIHNIGAGTCTITAGTATVNTAASLALAQWEGGSLYFTSASSAIFFRGGAAVEGIPVDYLVLSGGGGGGGCPGNAAGAGGGGGGLFVSYENETLPTGSGAYEAVYVTSGTNYRVQVGAGGSRGNAGTSGGSAGQGGRSAFGSVLVFGGGGGGNDGGNGGAGSNGGGGSGQGTGVNRAGGGPYYLGYTGGTGVGQNGTSPAGGGAGAGANGTASSTNTPGPGGAGLASSITGSSVTRGGGGGGGCVWCGGGAGGAGGGGAGRGPGTGIAGTTNLGGGGGGGGNNAAGGNGGSGLVILRYPDTYTITVGAGLTSSTTTDGTDKVTTFTAGSDDVSWS